MDPHRPHTYTTAVSSDGSSCYLNMRRPLALASMVRQVEPSLKAALAACTARSTSSLRKNIVNMHNLWGK